MQKPLLVVCAHHDPYCDRAALQLPGQARLEVIAHSDHFFGRGLTEMGRMVVGWLRGDRPEYIAQPDKPEEQPREPIRELELPGGEPLELDLERK
jgi:hypothetical protein